MHAPICVKFCMMVELYPHRASPLLMAIYLGVSTLQMLGQQNTGLRVAVIYFFFGGGEFRGFYVIVEVMERDIKNSLFRPVALF